MTSQPLMRLRLRSCLPPHLPLQALLPNAAPLPLFWGFRAPCGGGRKSERACGGSSTWPAHSSSTATVPSGARAPHQLSQFPSVAWQQLPPPQQEASGHQELSKMARIPQAKETATSGRTVAKDVREAAAALSLPAEAFGNDPAVEMLWAMKAHQHAEVYGNLISAVDPKFLKLTKADDQIYTEFRKSFKDLKIDVLDPEDLKSEPAKEKWRPFCLQFDGVVEDFNYGTLLRLDCSKGYTEENTVLATRIQFFAIEIARNREGYNSVVYNRAKEASSSQEELSSG